MFRKISLRLALIYGLTIILTTIVVDASLIYKYQRSQSEKNEASYTALGNIVSTIAGESAWDKDSLQTLVQEYGKNISGRMLILDYNGTVFGDSLKEYEGKKITNREIRETINENTKAIGYYSLNGKKLMILTVPVLSTNGNKGIVLISTYLKNIQVEIANFNKQVIWVSMAVLCFMLIMSFIIGKGISKPIEKLTSASEEILKGKLATKVDISRNDEIGKLALTFNSMSQELHKIEASRGRFISSVSHELKTPLASIKALIESLLEGNNDVPTYKEYLKDVNTEIDRLSGLVKSLLAASRLDEIQLKKENVSLFDEVVDVYNLFIPMAVKKNMKIVNCCGREVKVYADRSMLKEVLINLIDNSIKYGRDGGFIYISCPKRGDALVFKIKDDGYGIPAESIPYIFDNFYTVDEARRREKGGSGVGLYIVKKIADFHGWGVEVESKVNEGTELSIIIR